MKVLFLVQSVRGLNTGVGGHFYSLRTTAEALLDRLCCDVVCLGDLEAAPLRNAPFNVHHIQFGRRRKMRAACELISLIRREQPDVLHAFDPNSFYMARVAGMVTGKPVVHTKCGGPSPRRYYPLSRTQILYTEEDLRFFSLRSRHSGSHLHLIPNRVRRPRVDLTRVEALRRQLDVTGPIILRIGRFSPHYRDSLLQCVRLARRLHSDGVPCHLLLIGHDENDAVRSEVADALGDAGTIITTPAFTRNASELIMMGDVVVGTGRSLMEASACGKPLLTPTRHGAYPALVTPANFAGFFSTNFSPRNEWSSVDDDANYDAVREMVGNPQLRVSHGRFATQIFEEHFDIDHVLDRYVDVYRSAVTDARLHPMLFRRAHDFVLHSWLFLRSLRGAIS